MKTQSTVALMLLLVAVQGQEWLRYISDECGIGTNPCNSTDLDTLEIILYKNNSQFHFSLDASGAADTLNNTVFNDSSVTTVFMYGYTSTEESESSLQMREAYAVLESTTNFFMVNTSVVFGGVFINVSNYVQAAQKTVCVGHQVAKYLAELHKLNVSEDNIHLIGHSLGGQTAHATGVRFYDLRSVKVGRITGLDPAGPCFDPSDDQQLNKNDATHVNIIHTNAGVLGTNRHLGHADFVPNGGTIQPGCLIVDISCSHNRGSHLYRESVMGDNCIYAPRTEGSFLRRYLTNSNNVELAKDSGYRWDGTEGEFEAYTNRAFPFCRGEAGINVGE